MIWEHNTTQEWERLVAIIVPSYGHEVKCLQVDGSFKVKVLQCLSELKWTGHVRDVSIVKETVGEEEEKGEKEKDY